MKNLQARNSLPSLIIRATRLDYIDILEFLLVYSKELLNGMNFIWQA